MSGRRPAAPTTGQGRSPDAQESAIGASCPASPVQDPHCTQAATRRTRNKAMTMPTIFVSHGSPMLILEDRPARAFLASLGQLLPRPTAIDAVSAHCDTDVPAVSTAHKPATIHAFYRFPQALYALH